MKTTFINHKPVFTITYSCISDPEKIPVERILSEHEVREFLITNVGEYYTCNDNLPTKLEEYLNDPYSSRTKEYKCSNTRFYELTRYVVNKIITLYPKTVKQFHDLIHINEHYCIVDNYHPQKMATVLEGGPPEMIDIEYKYSQPVAGWYIRHNDYYLEAEYDDFAIDHNDPSIFPEITEVMGIYYSDLYSNQC